MTEETKQKREKSPWMFVSLFLGVLLIASMGFNFVITADAIANGGATEGTGNAVPPTGQGGGNPNLPTGGQIQVSVDDDAVLGNPNAPITIIEFSDFQCPFCGRFYSATEGQLIQNYVNTGKVKLVYRDFPLTNIHPQAQPAAEAAECADEQGKFWEYHDIIFQNQGALSTDAYKQWAAQLGLNTQQFNSCLDSGKYRAEVEKDFADGSTAGVSGTPTFFIGNDQIGYTRIVGAQPYSAFQPVIDQLLAA